MTNPYSIYSLGDSAITIDLGPTISKTVNDRVLAIRNWFREHPFSGLRDLVVGYSSLTIYYDPLQVKLKYTGSTAQKVVAEKLNEAYTQTQSYAAVKGKLHRIPVCYDDEFGGDLQMIAAKNDLSTKEVIALHTSITYRVFMIGFLPGFPYLGELPEAIATPRREKPKLVEAGSVGIAGKQTGIYPFQSPGGWNIIGRTNQKIFDATLNQPVWMEPGDEVQFYEISREEYEAD